MESFIEPLKEFSKNSVRLVKRCTKPDRKGELPNNSYDPQLESTTQQVPFHRM